MPEPRSETEQSDFYFIDRDDPEDVPRQARRAGRRRIPERFGLDPDHDIQVLAPMHRGELGATHPQRRAAGAAQPAAPSPELARFGWTYVRVGDKVMQTVQRLRQGRVQRRHRPRRSASTPEQPALVRVDFDGRRVDYERAELDELVPAYAITVHKSQGSEYPAVVIPLVTQHYMMLQRNLLYTAVTRGKRLVVVIGQTKALALAVKRLGSVKRLTNLQQRLRQAVQGREQDI